MALKDWNTAAVNNILGSFLQSHLRDDDMLMCVTNIPEGMPFPIWTSVKD